ncbi:hypothetical protein MTO96_033258 [Rhipicephalus appendiculatus]
MQKITARDYSVSTGHDCQCVPENVGRPTRQSRSDGFQLGGFGRGFLVKSSEFSWPRRQRMTEFAMASAVRARADMSGIKTAARRGIPGFGSDSVRGI